jgi:magnesium transporter
VTGRLVAGADAAHDASDGAIRALRASGDVFWLDVEAPAPSDRALLLDALGVDADSLEDVRRAGRRPGLDDHRDFVLVTVYGAGPYSDADRLTEVHCIVAPGFLVTLHEEPCPPLDELRRRMPHWHAPQTPALLLHRVVDALVESFLPLITELDSRGDEITDLVLEESPGEVQREILDTRRHLIGLRRVVIPQRDLLGRLAEADEDDLPGMTAEAARRFRGSYERMVRVGDALDGAREAAQAATDVYLGTVNNRLNVVMKQLTVIAGIFLPLTFITGFFGQNFGWMVGHIGSLVWFLALGVGLQVLTLVVLVLIFRRFRWL